MCSIIINCKQSYLLNTNETLNYRPRTKYDGWILFSVASVLFPGSGRDIIYFVAHSEPNLCSKSFILIIFICFLHSGATSNGPDLKCLYCQERFEESKHLEDHRETCAKKPPPVLQAPSVEGSRGSESPVINPTPRERWCQKPVHPDDQVRYPINEFTAYLKLSTGGKAGETLEEEKQRRQVECMDLDLDEEPCQTSLTSTPTKSSKTLLSQLSRDFSPPPVPVKSPRLKSVSEENDAENTEAKPKYRSWRPRFG